MEGMNSALKISPSHDQQFKKQSLLPSKTAQTNTEMEWKKVQTGFTFAMADPPNSVATD